MAILLNSIKCSCVVNILWAVDTVYKLRVENKINSNVYSIFYNNINLGYIANNFLMYFYNKLNLNGKMIILLKLCKFSNGS